MANVSRGSQQQKFERYERSELVPKPTQARFERLSRDALALMELDELRDALKLIDQQIGSGIVPRGATVQDLEVEWCYLRRELEFRGGRREP